MSEILKYKKALNFRANPRYLRRDFIVPLYTGTEPDIVPEASVEEQGMVVDPSRILPKNFTDDMPFVTDENNPEQLELAGGGSVERRGFNAGTDFKDWVLKKYKDKKIIDKTLTELIKDSGIDIDYKNAFYQISNNEKLRKQFQVGVKRASSGNFKTEKEIQKTIQKLKEAGVSKKEINTLDFQKFPQGIGKRDNRQLYNLIRESSDPNYIPGTIRQIAIVPALKDKIVKLANQGKTGDEIFEIVKDRKDWPKNYDRGSLGEAINYFDEIKQEFKIVPGSGGYTFKEVEDLKNSVLKIVDTSLQNKEQIPSLSEISRQTETNPTTVTRIISDEKGENFIKKYFPSTTESTRKNLVKLSQDKKVINAFKNGNILNEDVVKHVQKILKQDVDEAGRSLFYLAEAYDGTKSYLQLDKEKGMQKGIDLIFEAADRDPFNNPLNVYSRSRKEAVIEKKLGEPRFTFQRSAKEINNVFRKIGLGDLTNVDEVGTIGVPYKYGGEGYSVFQQVLTKSGDKIKDSINLLKASRMDRRLLDIRKKLNEGTATEEDVNKYNKKVQEEADRFNRFVKGDRKKVQPFIIELGGDPRKTIVNFDKLLEQNPKAAQNILDISKKEGWSAKIGPDVMTIYDFKDKAVQKQIGQGVLNSFKKFFNEYDEKKLIRILQNRSSEHLKKILKRFPRLAEKDNEYLQVADNKNIMTDVTYDSNDDTFKNPIQFMEENPITTGTLGTGVALLTKKGKSILKKTYDVFVESEGLKPTKGLKAFITNFYKGYGLPIQAGLAAAFEGPDLKRGAPEPVAQVISSATFGGLELAPTTISGKLKQIGSTETKKTIDYLENQNKINEEIDSLVSDLERLDEVVRLQPDEFLNRKILEKENNILLLQNKLKKLDTEIKPNFISLNEDMKKIYKPALERGIQRTKQTFPNKKEIDVEFYPNLYERLSNELPNSQIKIVFDKQIQEEKDAYEKTPFISGERIKKDVTNIFKNYENVKTNEDNTAPFTLTNEESSEIEEMGARTGAAEGGRIGLKEGTKIGRRGFLKFLAGAAAAPLVYKTVKGKKILQAAKVVKALPPVQGMPDWFPSLVSKIKNEGTFPAKDIGLEDNLKIRELIIPSKTGKGGDEIITMIEYPNGKIEIQANIEGGAFDQPFSLSYTPPKSDIDVTTGKVINEPGDFSVIEQRPRPVGGPEDAEYELDFETLTKEDAISNLERVEKIATGKRIHPKRVEQRAGARKFIEKNPYEDIINRYPDGELNYDKMRDEGLLDEIE